MHHEDDQEELAELRRKAEEQLEKERAVSPEAVDALALVHELQVHQVELELQNVELRHAKTEVEDLLRKVAELYDFAPIGYFTLDRNGKVVSANLTGSKLLGVARSFIVGKPLWPYVSADSRQVMQEFLSSIPSNGKRRTIETMLLHDRKTPLFALIEGVAVEGVEGEPATIRIAVTNITDRRNVESALESANQELKKASLEMQAFVASVADGVIMTDGEGNLLLANKAARELLDMPQEQRFLDWIAEFIVRKLNGEPLAFKQTPFYLALEGETLNDERVIIITPRGKEVVLSVSAAPARDPDQGVLGAVYVLRDARERIDFERYLSTKYDHEHYIAYTLQKALLPKWTEYSIDNCEIAVSYEPGSKEAEIGGDFFDVFELGDRLIGILVGDVTGKGLMAATRAVAARHTVRSYAYLNPSPALVMTLANQALCRTEVDETAVLTALSMVLDTRSQTITYCSGGHEPPILVDKQGNTIELSHPGMAMGVIPEHVYTEASRVLNAGEILVAFTDGITEARTDTRFFGKEGIIEYLSANARASVREIVSGLLDAAKVFAEGHLRDDEVVLALTLRGKDS